MSRRDNREELFADTIKGIHLALRSSSSYPEDHPTCREIISKAYESLTDLLNRQNTLTVSVNGDRLLVDDVPLDGKTNFSTKLAMDLEQRGIDSITFYQGLSEKDLRSFLDVMIKSSHVLSQKGSVAFILQQRGVSTIKFNEIKYGRISEEAKEQEDSHIIKYLSGESDTLGDYRYNFLWVLENDPGRISDLVMRVSETADIAEHPYSQAARAKVGAETINRIATELVAGEGCQWSQFRDSMTAMLFTFNEDALTDMLQAVEITEGEKGEIVDCLVSEFLHDAIAEICVKDYRQSGRFDMEFVERLVPSVEEQKKLFPYLRKKVRELGIPDEGRIISGFLCEESEASKAEEEEIWDYHEEVSEEGEKGKLKEDLAKLLSEGKDNEVEKIVGDLTQKLDDTSWKIRKKVAESLLEVTSVLDEFDKLKANFRDLSEALIKRVKEENNSDTYLIASENLERVCASQRSIDGYLINETIGRRLLEADKISKSQLQKALVARKQNGRSLQYNLEALDVADEATFTHYLAQQYNGCRVVQLSEIGDIPENVLKAVPVKFIKRYLILPFMCESGSLYTATMNPDDMDVFDDIRFISGYSVVPHLAAEYYLLKAIEKFYHVEVTATDGTQVMEDIRGDEGLEFCEEEEQEQEEAPPMEELKDSDAPVIKLVNLIIKAAVTQKASDIHIEPYEDELRVRFRVDGTLSTLLSPSIKFASVIASRIKIMAGLDISERRLPQDGRFKIRTNGNYVDFRISTFPGIFGEKVVLRLLDKSNLTLDINNLGLNGDDLNTLQAAMYKSKGMMLVTGPTGSGKTTTLYSMLHALNDGSRNISTAEDPIEYNLKGINQFQMHAKIGLNFARALRTFLRQDPDVIMVGEIRDLETAEIAVKAALTGHLVLSTLHTNSAPETITRLLDMGIEPYLITSSVSLILAQRLMRKTCERCKVEASPNDLQLKLLNDYRFDITGHQVFKGEGCEDCNNTGYKGRMAIYEVMQLWDEIQELILKGESASEIKAKAEDLGLVTLQRQGFNKVIEGVTDLDEWMRVVT